MKKNRRPETISGGPVIFMKANHLLYSALFLYIRCICWTLARWKTGEKKGTKMKNLFNVFDASSWTWRPSNIRDEVVLVTKKMLVEKIRAII